jgi:hypothetical protein
MCAAVLKKSGAYTVIVSPFKRDGKRPRNIKGQDTHAAGLLEIGRQWRELLDTYGTQISPEGHNLEALFPAEVKNRWEIAHKGRNTELFRIVGDAELLQALMDLLAISDEACSGIGLPQRPDPATADIVAATSGNATSHKKSHLFREEAEYVLLPKQFGSTLCKTISPAVARVLPKMHTAQCGLTIRSFSHHLAYCESDEVRPSWISVPGSRGDATELSRMNLLVAPWPQEILPTQIGAIKDRPLTHPYNSFGVDIASTQGKVAAHSLALVRAAENLVGKIDAVVFPELALTSHDYRLARSALLREGILVIAGVGVKSRFTNYLTVDVPVSKHYAVHFRQRKHHRWKLDEQQINQYHLGARLNPELKYWEDIDVQDRQLNFIVLRPWLVTTALICEDLARHDPVGDLIKGVGPNLVMALLMDGPQITQRWSSRYAAGLADDPGCSVLSITSLGMAALSRPRSGDDKSSRVIGLWKDAFSGAPTQIDLPKGSDGVVITLTLRKREEKTADYRSDGGLARYPSLAGFHFVKLPPPQDIPELPEALAEPKWISPSDAAFLARLAQRDSLTADFMPDGLDALQGAAFQIGREIWRQKTSGAKPSDSYQWPNRNTWGEAAEEDTAEQIINWHKTNQSFLQ